VALSAPLGALRLQSKRDRAGHAFGVVERRPPIVSHGAQRHHAHAGRQKAADMDVDGPLGIQSHAFFFFCSSLGSMISVASSGTADLSFSASTFPSPIP